MKSTHYDNLLPFFEDALMQFHVPNVLTVNKELYVNQKLFLLQVMEMKIVEVVEICETDDSLHIKVKNLHNHETIELSHPLNNPTYPITWIVVSIPFIIERVIEQMKQ